jgi:hypothetical protein
MVFGGESEAKASPGKVAIWGYSAVYYFPHLQE